LDNTPAVLSPYGRNIKEALMVSSDKINETFPAIGIVKLQASEWMNIDDVMNSLRSGCGILI
jgi:hypothetical protein